MEQVDTQGTWNKKRIFLAIFLAALFTIGGYFLKTIVFGENASQPSKSVEGISTKNKDTEPAVKINVQEAVKEKIDNIKQQVLGLNIVEIASSSPQVQRIINDIKSLEQYPANQVKEVCRKICGL